MLEILRVVSRLVVESIARRFHEIAARSKVLQSGKAAGESSGPDRSSENLILLVW